MVSAWNMISFLNSYLGQSIEIEVKSPGGSSGWDFLGVSSPLILVPGKVS